MRVADASFNGVDQMRYRAYGESRDAGTNLKTDHKFTSQIEDTSIGLHCRASRAHDRAIGRFTAPHPIAPNGDNPQGLSGCSRTSDNPLR